MKEIWKKVNLYGKEYFVSNTGIIKNKYNKILKPYLSSGNYGYIIVRENSHNHHIRIHKLVAQTFIPNPDNLPQINHIDGNKLNNAISNLEWITCSENIKHAINNNLYKPKGTPTKIHQYDLNHNFIKTWNKMSDVEKEYNVSHTALRFCCLGKIKTCAGYIWRYTKE